MIVYFNSILLSFGSGRFAALLLETSRYHTEIISPIGIRVGSRHDQRAAKTEFASFTTLLQRRRAVLSSGTGINNIPIGVLGTDCSIVALELSLFFRKKRKFNRQSKRYLSGYCAGSRTI